MCKACYILLTPVKNHLQVILIHSFDSSVSKNLHFRYYCVVIINISVSNVRDL